MASGNQGFASMDEKKHKTISSKGGKSDGGNFKQSTTRASREGKKGAAAQPTEAKAAGGKRSHGTHS